MNKHLKQTEADLQVQRDLWAATERELMSFANVFAGAHDPKHGRGHCEAEKDVLWAAAKKGYRRRDVAHIGYAIRAGRDYSRNLAAYRAAIGLAV